MAAKAPKKSTKPPVGDDTPEAAVVNPARRPLVVNLNIDGTWYGPSWGNADAYPDEGHDGRPKLFEA